jgi:hypothetical protein
MHMEKKSGNWFQWSVLVGFVLLGWLSPVNAVQQKWMSVIAQTMGIFI